MSNHRNIPYVPPPTKKVMVNLKYSYERIIAYGVQMRGDNDDVPTIIYYGAPWQLLEDCFDFVHNSMGDSFESIVMRREHSCRWKNGKAFHRIAVEIHRLNEDFLTLQSFLLIINNYMQRICWCKVKELPLKRLLNL